MSCYYKIDMRLQCMQHVLDPKRHRLTNKAQPPPLQNNNNKTPHPLSNSLWEECKVFFVFVFNFIRGFLYTFLTGGWGGERLSLRKTDYNL